MDLEHDEAVGPDLPMNFEEEEKKGTDDDDSSVEMYVSRQS